MGVAVLEFLYPGIVCKPILLISYQRWLFGEISIPRKKSPFPKNPQSIKIPRFSNSPIPGMKVSRFKKIPGNINPQILENPLSPGIKSCGHKSSDLGLGLYIGDRGYPRDLKIPIPWNPGPGSGISGDFRLGIFCGFFGLKNPKSSSAGFLIPGDFWIQPKMKNPHPQEIPSQSHL